MRVLGSIERMTIHQTKKQSDLEKRLKLLRQQVYGKEDRMKLEVRSEKSNFALQNPTSSQSDLTYLHQDLFKIVTLSTVAIGAEFILLFLLKNNLLLRLNFF